MIMRFKEEEKPLTASMHLRAHCSLLIIELQQTNNQQLSARSWKGLKTKACQRSHYHGCNGLGSGAMHWSPLKLIRSLYRCLLSDPRITFTAQLQFNQIVLTFLVGRDRVIQFTRFDATLSQCCTIVGEFVEKCEMGGGGKCVTVTYI